MYIFASTLDDLMNHVIRRLVEIKSTVRPTRGSSKEIIGVLLHLKNPRSRLSLTETKGTPFSALGELLWYLSKTNDLDFIKYYLKEYENNSEDGETIYGGYGPRLFNFRKKYNQVNNVIDLLRAKPTTRRAVIQIFDAEDIDPNINGNRVEVPCTCTLQFLIRDEKLHMITSMRSNDAYLGLPHDIFAFTMIQEIIARTLKVEIGEYKHGVGSLHLYKDHEELAIQYLEEGHQTTVGTLMPKMPKNDPWSDIDKMLEIESKFRNSQEVAISSYDLSSYWEDLAKLLQIHNLFKNKEYEEIKSVMRGMHWEMYKSHIDKRLDKALNKSN